MEYTYVRTVKDGHVGAGYSLFAKCPLCGAYVRVLQDRACGCGGVRFGGKGHEIVSMGDARRFDLFFGEYAPEPPNGSWPGRSDLDSSPKQVPGTGNQSQAMDHEAREAGPSNAQGGRTASVSRMMSGSIWKK